MTTLLKCISAATILSGVATADSADNVSSRLQVHVRDNFPFCVWRNCTWRRGRIYRIQTWILPIILHILDGMWWNKYFPLDLIDAANMILQNV